MSPNCNAVAQKAQLLGSDGPEPLNLDPPDCTALTLPAQLPGSAVLACNVLIAAVPHT